MWESKVWRHLVMCHEPPSLFHISSSRDHTRIVHIEKPKAPISVFLFFLSQPLPTFLPPYKWILSLAILVTPVFQPLRCQHTNLIPIRHPWETRHSGESWLFVLPPSYSLPPYIHTTSIISKNFILEPINKSTILFAHNPHDNCIDRCQRNIWNRV